MTSEIETRPAPGARGAMDGQSVRLASEGAATPADASGDRRTRRRALVSLAVAGVAIVAFLVGLQEAVRRIPPEMTEAQADSVRRARARQAQAERDRVNGPPPAYQVTQPEELPRLR